MPNSDQKEEVKSIDRKVLAFGMIAVSTLLCIIVMGLMVALYAMSNKYLDAASDVNSCRDTAHTLQRALDRSDGRLAVYEEFVTDRKSDVVRRTIASFISKEKVKPGEVTLETFQQWIGGVGGPMNSLALP